MAKDAIASNQRALQQYSWTEQTNVLVNGTVQTKMTYACQYGPDGTVTRTPVGSPFQNQDRKAKELEKYVQEAVALMGKYVPLDPQKMQAAFDVASATLNLNGPILQLQFSNYLKFADTVVCAFNVPDKILREVIINSHLNDVNKGASLQVNYQTLPAGPNYPAQITLKYPAKSMQVQTTNSNYKKVAQ